MLPTLRGDQPKNLEQLRAAVARGKDPLLCAACGYGKGTLISYIVSSAVQMGHQVIFGVRGKSLVDDMHLRVKALGVEHGVLMGAVQRQRWHPVQVASVDTLYRMEHLPEVTIFIIDECHMALSATWRLVVERARKSRADRGLSRLVVIGMTATPVRLDGKGLGRLTGGLFDEMVLGPQPLQLIREGYLVRSRVLEPPAVEGAREIKLGNTDNLEAQAAVFDRITLIGDEISHYKQNAAGRKGVTFCTNQKHAQHMAEAFREAGVPWAYVDADTPMGDECFPKPGTRAHIYRDLDAMTGTLMGVATVGTTTTGWNHPIVSYLGIMRRTNSFGLWHQIMGRGSRIFGGKTDFLIIDHAGNTELHKPYGYFESPITWSLDGKAVKEREPGERRVITCRQSVMNCWCGRAADHDGPNHIPCYGTFFAGPRQCPWCGCPVPKKDVKIDVERDTQLVEKQRDLFGPSVAREVAKIFKSAGPRVVNETTRRRDLDWFLRQAMEKNYKPGHAWHKYVARYGEAPPRDWMPDDWRAEHAE